MQATAILLVKKFLAFYCTRKFIIILTTARHWSFFRSSSIQSTPTHPTSLNPILIFSSHLHSDLPSNLFPSDLPQNLYAPMNTMLPCFTHCPAAICFVMPILAVLYHFLSGSKRTFWMRSLHQNDVSLRVRCVCVCVCVYIYIYIYIPTHTHTHTHTYTDTNKHTHDSYHVPRIS